ncbi:hypothetical protein ACTFIV_005203 [Dictyostelium citrinum]
MNEVILAIELPSEVNAQASPGRVHRNNISKEIYGSEVLQPIKIKDTPKMFDETETERFRKSQTAVVELWKSTFKKPGGSNIIGNSSNNIKPNSGSSGTAGSVASGNNVSKSVSGSNNRFQKNKN